MYEIAQMLGHSEQRTTEDYAQFHPDFTRAATHAIARQLAPQLHPNTESRHVSDDD